MKNESGRTLIEIIAVLGVMGVLAIGAIRVYNFITTKTKVQNTAQMIKTLAFERQNAAVNNQINSHRTIKGAHLDFYMENGQPEHHELYFWITVKPEDKDFCKMLKEAEIISADFIEVDGNKSAECTDDSELSFFFKKNKSGSIYCPLHSSACDSYGAATTCVDGYYLEDGDCHSCPAGVLTCVSKDIHTTCKTGYTLGEDGKCYSSKSCPAYSLDCDDDGVATECKEGYYLDDGVCSHCTDGAETCSDENIHTKCLDGYEMGEDNKCHSVFVCHSDLDCEVCASCNNGTCEGNCFAEPDEDNSCGDNECIVYDEENQVCKNACKRLEYLISTGTQYIDTGYKSTPESKWEADFESSKSSADTTYDSIFGAQTSGTTYRVSSIITSGNVSNRVGLANTSSATSIKDIAIEFSSPSEANNRHIYGVDVKNFKGYMDGTATLGTSYSGLKTDYNVVILARNSAKTISNYAKGKLYGFKHWEGGELVQDLIPVTDPENQPAMYDRVSGKLFHSAKGQFLIPHS